MLAKKRIHDWAVAMAKTLCQLLDPEMCGWQLEQAMRELVPMFVSMLESYEMVNDRALYIQSPSTN